MQRDSSWYLRFLVYALAALGSLYAAWQSGVIPAAPAPVAEVVTDGK